MRISKLDDVAEGVGRHCIYELYGGNPNKLNDKSFVKEALTSAANHSGATLLSLTSHKFEPQGVTALALLSESHISIHTWPELNYAAIDVFTCGQHTNPDAACELLKQELKAGRSIVKIFSRAIPIPNEA